MKIYNIPELLKTIIFDIDATLYTCPEYANEQIDCQIRYWAELNGLSHDEGRKRINEFRKKWADEHNGQKISLGNTFTHFGISIETSIEWRNSLMNPAQYLSKNDTLIKSLASLSKKFNLITVTNNPVALARKTLEVIGISDFFPEIIGLDTCYASKPSEKSFSLAAEKTHAKPSECLSVGDRFDIDLALPLQMGMGAVLVNGAEEVCELSKLLLSDISWRK